MNAKLREFITNENRCFRIIASNPLLIPQGADVRAKKVVVGIVRDPENKHAILEMRRYENWQNALGELRKEFEFNS